MDVALSADVAQVLHKWGVAAVVGLKPALRAHGLELYSMLLGSSAWTHSAAQPDGMRSSLDLTGPLPGTLEFCADGLYEDGERLQDLSDARTDLPPHTALLANIVSEAEPLARVAYSFFFGGNWGLFHPVGSTYVGEEDGAEGPVRLSRLNVNLMLVHTRAHAAAQRWHCDQFPFLRVPATSTSLSADVHAGIRLSGPYGSGDPPAGIEYQPGSFGLATDPLSPTYVPDASSEGAALLHTGDVVHRGTATEKERLALYIGFTPRGVNLTHAA